MDRREFLKRAGATGIVIAGAALGAVWLHDPRSGAEYFRDSKSKKTKSLKSYRVNRMKGATDMTVVRGKDPEKMMRAGLGEMAASGPLCRKAM